MRLLASLEPHWDEWTGALALEGHDPRTWDLKRLLAAWEAQIRRGCKDESEWNRTRARLYAPVAGAQAKVPRSARVMVPGAADAPAAPREEGTVARPARRLPAGPGLDAREADAMLARFALADAAFDR